MISRQDYERMSKIIIGMNTGTLPVSALKDAKPLLKKSPQLLAKRIADQIKGTEYDVNT